MTSASPTVIGEDLLGILLTIKRVSGQVV
jgi:hypothetical protein